ncbi:hypothetical protein QBC39DRAFT_89764 [Podospora conica]|nr:hypothetical protein QBC39DRAFT_89764 [Schizothecium conicum]
MSTSIHPLPSTPRYSPYPPRMVWVGVGCSHGSRHGTQFSRRAAPRAKNRTTAANGTTPRGNRPFLRMMEWHPSFWSWCQDTPRHQHNPNPNPTGRHADIWRGRGRRPGLTALQPRAVLEPEPDYGSPPTPPRPGPDPTPPSPPPPGEEPNSTDTSTNIFLLFCLLLEGLSFLFGVDIFFLLYAAKEERTTEGKRQHLPVA